MLRRISTKFLFTLALLQMEATVWGQAVIMNGDYFLTHNEAGTAVNATATTTFNPSTCLWAYASRDYIRTADSNGNAINNNNNYLQYDELSLGTDWGNWYRGDDNEAIYHRTGGTFSRRYHYPTRSNTTWGWAYNQTSQNSTTSLYDVTITPQAATSTNPTINGADVITATGNSTYTATGAVYRAAYTNYYFRTANHYVDVNGNSFTDTPGAATIGTYTWNLESNSYATVNSGVVTVSSLPQSDVTLTLTVTVAVSGGTPAAPAGTTLTASKEITIQGTTPSAPIINVSGNSVTLSTEAAGTTSIRYTLDGSDPTATNGTVYNGAIDLSTSTTSPVTIKAVTVRNDNVSAVTTQVVTLTLPAPVITADAETGTATISATAGATIYYTTDGSEPTTSSSQYSGSLSGLSAMTTIKAIAVKEGWNDSPVASETLTISSGADGNTVTLFDYEDHNWTYYSGVDASVDGGNYNTNYAGKLYSPNPRNVKITYRANGGAVSIDESETEFVYYKTLEQGITAGQYPYTVISNPFSKRPKGQGFRGWKIISGGEYIQGHNNGDVLNLDEDIAFVNLPYPSVNCTSAEIEFQATWVALNNITRASGNNVTYSVTGGTYETNILVLNGNTSATIAPGSSVTIMMVEPDGSNDYRNSTFTGNITPNNGGVTKIEWAHWQPGNNNVDARGRNFTIGRGMTMDGTRRALYGTAQTSAMNQVLKVESGNFSTFTSYTANPSSITRHWVVLGCDYDRAKGDNTKLTFSGRFLTGEGRTLGLTSTGEMARVWSKSGGFMTGVSVSNAAAENSYYIGVTNTHNDGHRYLEIQGGEWYANIAGGMGEDHAPNEPAFTFRMRGGTIRGSVYGAAAYAGAGGTRTYVITGGSIGGWVACGANGTQSDGGLLDGATYIYVGGKARIDSNGSTSVINRAVGGNVFGAGCGYGASSNSGQISLGTNVVVADKAYIERGVYGGGSYGFTEATSNLYVTGGTVDGKNGGVNGTTYQASITGGVFGGACQNRGGTVNITMTGGQVNGGMYGGSNVTGTIAGSVTINVNGGQVGTSSATANIHGGGFGQPTRVSQNVDITLGASGQTTPGVTVYGDVYGGSALGYVNGTAATNTYHTYVTMNKGTINGSLYGGGLGDGSNAANVYGPVIVTVNGGIVNTTSADGSGAVYGCNNINGAPQRAVAVVINGTDPAPSEGVYALDAVYGGGNRANYSYGTPTVTVNNCDNSIGYVYGGGNAAHITNGNTDVTIYGGNKIGNVFGGGNGTVSAANVSGNTDVKIYGGTIGSVYGGSNTRGTIGGTINVLVNKTSSSSCAMHIDEVYGGGNMAPSNAGNVTIGCTGDEGEGIGDVYGGANAANITGDVSLLITGGSIERVFGGNNASGNVSGNIAVNIDWTDPSTCGYNYLGYVYGAGNKADYAGSPVVNIKNGTVSHDVFGGGLQANVGGSVTVNMLGGSVEGALYGGGALAHTNTNGGTTSVNLVGGTVHDVYGGGLGQKKGFNDATEDIEAYVNGNVTVTLNGSEETGATNDCKVTGNIFGCNNLNGSPKGNVVVNIRRTVGYDDAHKKSTNKDNTTYDVAAVYGGGNMAAYVPSNPETTEAKATVNIYGCGDTSIQYVYGGGNAASVPASEVTVHGCYEIGYVFGGGNGKDKLPNGQENPGANVGYYTYEYNGQTGEVISGTRKPYGTGVASVKLLGGRIHSAFGGSNTKGNVCKAAVAFLDEADDQCLLHIDDVYGGGNEAYMDGNAQIKLGCITSLAVIYGGSKRANVGGDIVLNITSGHFDRIFGGNNESGYIKGSITVNIEETGCHPITIGELYGCGNQAPYITPTGKADPTVNVKSFTSIGRIFGGGLGEGAVVTGNPTVNINEVVGKNASYSPWEYPGKTITFSEGDVTLPEHTAGAIGVIGEVFGGGNAADVVGNTTVNIGTAETVDYVSAAEKGIKVEGANILGNVYGGGNNANVSGKANVVVGRN